MCRSTAQKDLLYLDGLSREKQKNNKAIIRAGGRAAFAAKNDNKMAKSDENYTNSDK
jgi:hypothetical protein